jgi:hypothetical protein
MRTFSALWSVLKGLAEGVVILVMFHIANSAFETMVVSGLVLIYTSVTGTFKGLGYALHGLGRQSQWRYIQIAKSLKHPEPEIDLLEAARKEDEEEREKHMATFWISIGFNTLYALIAIGYLLSVVVQQF